MNLSKNFILAEFLRSETAYRRGILMDPPTSVVDELRRLCETTLQPLRDALGVPMVITSGWRPEALNSLIGGSVKSDHVSGRAADVHAIGKSVLEVCEAAIQLTDAPIKQIILEFSQWAHISIMPAGEPPRREILTAYRHEGKTAYVAGFRSDVGTRYV